MTGSFRKWTTPPYQDQLKQLAGQQQNLAGELTGWGTQYLQPALTGQLPPGQEAQVQLALSNANAASQGEFAHLNLGDSTMAASALGYNQLNADALRAKIAEALASVGTSLTGQAGQGLGGATSAYNDLATQQVAEDNALMQAIASLTGGAVRAGAGVPGAPGGGGGFPGLHMDQSGFYFGQ